MQEKQTSVHYHAYLKLDQILNAQSPRSAEFGASAHDEMLFIIVHQVYELWFKQIIYELRSIIAMFNDQLVDEREIGLAVSRLDRVIEIQQLIINQIRVMETMTSLDFLDFRNYLFPASGFQSFQFRVLEIMMGLRAKDRLQFNKMSFDEVFDQNKKDVLASLEERSSLLEVIIDWLERTPFLEFEGFRFQEAYQNAVRNMLSKEHQAIDETDLLSTQEKAQRHAMLEKQEEYFASVFDPLAHAERQKAGQVKFSYKATIAALLIHLYRDEPILQLPYQFLTKTLDMEELFTTWRYRHAQMVLRMIGRKTGTGGSSGHDYLQATAKQHHVFSDLYNIATLLIPRSELPQLPKHLRDNLGFYFTVSKTA